MYMDQQIINWAVAACGALLGFMLHSVWDAVKDLQKSDKELAAKVADIEILVAGNYVTRTELKSYIDTIFLKLDHISEKLSDKADK